MTSRPGSSMQAVASFQGLPISHADSLMLVTLPIPDLRPRDILVAVQAVSVNPADVQRRAALASGPRPTVLGFDAAGVVAAVGADARGHAVGDEVFYAGDVNRQGSNAEFQAVDERIVGRKPTSLSFAEAAAMPLTTITAWETLFDRFGVTETSEGTLLVMAAAGGVGSVLVQLAKKLTGLTVIGTAARSDSQAFAARMGADHVIGRSDLVADVLAVAPTGTDYIFTANTAGNIEAFAAIAKPFSAITTIDAPQGLDLRPLFHKSISWQYEWMFTRVTYDTPDLVEQQRLLNCTADLLDAGTLITTLTTVLDGFTPENLREAHRLLESGQTVGKVVVAR